MRMYLYGESKLQLGYTPDWIRFEHDNEEWTFDIQGDIDYDIEKLNCRVKGELVPWVLIKNGYEITLNGDEFSEDLFDDIFKDATNITIGIYPCRDEDENSVYDDEITDKECKLYYGNKEYEFTFDVEINL